MTNRLPNVLVISGNDPSGGAGMAADIQAITALSAHPAPVITTLTVQDTQNASAVVPIEPDLIVDQATAVLEDMPIEAIKIGLLGNAAIGSAVADLLDDEDDYLVIVGALHLIGDDSVVGLLSAQGYSLKQL